MTLNILRVFNISVWKSIFLKLEAAVLVHKQTYFSHHQTFG